MKTDIDKDQVEEITRIVLLVINKQVEEKKAGGKSVFSKIVATITGNWAVFLFFIGVVGSIIGLLAFGASPFHTFREIAHKQEEYDRAQEQFKYEQSMVDRHLALANSFLSTSHLEAAKAEFEKVLTLDKYNTEAHFGKLKSEIFIPIQNRKIDEEYNPDIAQKKLRVLLKERPNDPHIYSFLGDVFLGVNDDSARRYYQRVTRIDSSVASAYAGMAMWYDFKSNVDSAIRMYQKAYSLSPWHQVYINNLAYQYYLAGRYIDAIRLYEKVLMLDDDFVLSYFTLASSYRLLGQVGKSQFYYNRAGVLLDNEEIIKRKKNEGAWFFHVDGSRTIWFFNLSMKKCYAYYEIALTAHLRGQGSLSNEYMEKAKKLMCADEYQVKTLINYEVDQLRDHSKFSPTMLDIFLDDLN